MNKFVVLSVWLSLMSINTAYSQTLVDISLEVGKWRFEQDMSSMWEFKSDGKLYTFYDGSTYIGVRTYEISTTPPVCPDAQLAIKPNIKFMKTVNLSDGYVNCYYIYGLNDKRLTLMDAVTGHIFPTVRVEE